MTPALLSLIMDFVVLVALAGTIYYAMRLSKALNGFKSHRDELKTLIIELSSNIDQAGNAIINLKSASNTAANDLDDVLHDARRMAEELKMINTTGDNLASRLENLAQRSSQVAQSHHPVYEEPETIPPETAEENLFAPDAPSFFIQDFDLLDEAAPPNSQTNTQDSDNEDFTSQAEKELYAALQKNKTSRGRS